MSRARTVAIGFSLLMATPFLSAPSAGQEAKKSAAKTPAAKKGAVALEQLRKAIDLRTDVEYGRAGERSLKLDLLLPKKAAENPRPVIVWVHGGAWKGGNKSQGIGLLAPLVMTGDYVGASLSYRFSQEAIWPAQIHDCKAAIRFLRANAKEFNIDPDRIGVWGGSAGGHLVNLLGTSGGVKELEGINGSADQSSKVACVVDFCGPTDFLAYAEFPRTQFGAPKLSTAPESELIGGPLYENKKVATAASPVTYVSSDDPPVLIVHGSDDPLVPFAQAELFAKALKKANVDVILVKIEGGGHSVLSAEVYHRVRMFFERHLRDRKVEVSGEPIKAVGEQLRGVGR